MTTAVLLPLLPTVKVVRNKAIDNLSLTAGTGSMAFLFFGINHRGRGERRGSTERAIGNGEWAIVRVNPRYLSPHNAYHP